MPTKVVATLIFFAACGLLIAGRVRKVEGTSEKWYASGSDRRLIIRSSGLLFGALLLTYISPNAINFGLGFFFWLLPLLVLAGVSFWMLMVESGSDWELRLWGEEEVLNDPLNPASGVLHPKKTAWGKVAQVGSLTTIAVAMLIAWLVVALAFLLGSGSADAGKGAQPKPTHPAVQANPPAPVMPTPVATPTVTASPTPTATPTATATSTVDCGAPVLVANNPAPTDKLSNLNNIEVCAEDGTWTVWSGRGPQFIKVLAQANNVPDSLGNHYNYYEFLWGKKRYVIRESSK